MKKNAGFIFLMFSENWLKIFVNRIKQKYTNLHIKKMWQANLTVASTYSVLKSKNLTHIFKMIQLLKLLTLTERHFPVNKWISDQYFTAFQLKMLKDFF